MSFIRKTLELLTGLPTPRLARKNVSERQLIERENEIGRHLFGPIPADHRRDFFCLDENTWVWHEEWKDVDGKTQTATTRYEIQPAGILKVQSGRVYKYIEGEELRHLVTAVRFYYERVMREVYGFDPATGQRLNQLQ